MYLFSPHHPQGSFVSELFRFMMLMCSPASLNAYTCEWSWRLATFFVQFSCCFAEKSYGILLLKLSESNILLLKVMKLSEIQRDGSFLFWYLCMRMKHRSTHASVPPPPPPHFCPNTHAHKLGLLEHWNWTEIIVHSQNQHNKGVN